ncbi:MAG TPA: FAD-dependent monooxygenase [Burkholderiales bacterium]|nr:FAD-dependent monooxygenase [Burkholderiales bacterium]
MTESPGADAAIVGGGPVGTALAIALARSDVRAVLLESRVPATAPTDPRPIALSYGSRLILERLNVWEALGRTTPIERIHVSQQGGFGHALMAADRAGLPALGYVVEYARLQNALTAALQAARGFAVYGAQVTAIHGDHEKAAVDYHDAEGERTLIARVVIIADGGAVSGATTKVIDYHQAAVVAVVSSELPHGGTAFERFTPEGPLALLPCGKDLALVWSMKAEAAMACAAEPTDTFLARLHRAFGGRVGRFTAVGARLTYPLALRIGRAAMPRTLYVGNASQTLHPVAGQGFNIGLRDAWELSAQIRDAERGTLGTSPMLEACEKRRRLDRRGGTVFTDALVRIFSNDFPPLRAARGLGLAALDALPPAKDVLVRRMIFGARG